MTTAFVSRDTGGSAVRGAAGGCLAGLVAAIVVTVCVVLAGRSATVGVNAFGAWFVRWLQTAAPDALDQFYFDATVGGVALMLIVGSLGGALFSAALSRLPDDHPLAWGAIGGAALWLLARHAIGPALDPVLVRTLDWRILLPTLLAYGLTIGWWVGRDRAIAAGVWSRLGRP